jgi:tetratricopeptide (TPR) repeat protein
MKLAALTLLFAMALGAARENKADIAAQRAWEQVEASPVPTQIALYDCVVTGIEVVKKGKKERGVTMPRQAYCRFMIAATTPDPVALKRSPEDFAAARAESRADCAPLLNLLGLLARFRVGEEPGPELNTALQTVNCQTPGFTSEQTCSAVLRAGWLWQAWLASKKDDRQGAALAFQHVSSGHWSAWFAGLNDLESRRWREAATLIGEAVKTFSAQDAPRNVTDLLGPKSPELGVVYAKLGLAQFMSGQLEASIPSLDRAVGARPFDAASLFLRARVREKLGFPGPALLDLDNAAKAAPPDVAHFYRGVLLQREKHFPDAAKELALAPASVPDAAAWKLFAEAEAGSCAPDALDKAASEASPLFPAADAKAAALDCRIRLATSLEQLLALDSGLHTIYKDPEAQDRIATAYIRLGVEAEDRKDAYAAVIAYRKALEWSPKNTKARFNLAAVYIGDLKYDLAEREYRALLAADPSDYEAAYWLAQSILGARPAAPRRTEACELLKKSLQIKDAERRTEFAASLKTAKCP